jgi:hypothetical protein
MREDWGYFRAVWNAEADKLTHAGLAEKLGFDKSYIGPLGRGNKRFNEDIMERFSQLLELPLSVLFTEVALKIPTRESEEMNKIREMVRAMMAVEDIKDILLGKYKEVKKDYADELSKKKLPQVLCKILD